MKLIAITGYKLSGKTTVAEQLRRMHMPLKSAHINFADAVKNEVCRAFSITREYLETHKENFRLILQGVGTDYRRKLCGETYWINKWIKTIIEQEQQVSLIVTSDLRFLNEAETIKQCGGKIIRVHRSGCSSDGHISETELDKIKADFEITNDGDISSLRKQLETLNIL